MMIAAFVAFGSSLLVGCGGGPRYGAARKQSKSCDCPTWNAAPTQVREGTWSQREDLPEERDERARN